MGEERREGRRVDTELLGRGSVLLAGEGESSSVHEESVARLGALSEQEILEEQSRLLAAMDPSLVDWIRSKKKEKTAAVEVAMDMSIL